jgi:Fic family protein
LERTQKGGLGIIAWLEWFVECLGRVIDCAEATLGDMLRMAPFWQTHGTEPFNDRRRQLLSRQVDDLEGKLSSPKCAKLARCSQDTALRDIPELVERGILIRIPAADAATATVCQTNDFGTFPSKSTL